MIGNLFCGIFVIIAMFSIDKTNEVKTHIYTYSSGKVPTDKAELSRKTNREEFFDEDF
jgi:hypothetical protein